MRIAKVEVALRDGEHLVTVVEANPDVLAGDTAESVEFAWTDGSRSCDCVREEYLAKGVPGYLATGKCGLDRIELVRLEVTFADGTTELLVGEA